MKQLSVKLFLKWITDLNWEKLEMWIKFDYECFLVLPASSSIVSTFMEVEINLPQSTSLKSIFNIW